MLLLRRIIAFLWREKNMLHIHLEPTSEPEPEQDSNFVGTRVVGNAGSDRDYSHLALSRRRKLLLNNIHSYV